MSNNKTKTSEMVVKKEQNYKSCKEHNTKSYAKISQAQANFSKALAQSNKVQDKV